MEKFYFYCEPIDEEAKDNDVINKQKGKVKEDRARGSTDFDLKVGVKVLLQNMNTTNKLETRFGNEEYEVTDRKGNEVTVMKDGKTYKRHVTHVKVTADELARSHKSRLWSLKIGWRNQGLHLSS